MRRKTPGALSEIAVPAVEPLIAALRSKRRPGLRDAAARALGKLGDTRAVEPLITTLKSRGHGRVRAAAALALGKLGDTRALEALIVALRDRDENVRDAAARARGEAPATRAEKTLIAALKRPADRSSAPALLRARPPPGHSEGSTIAGCQAP
jgi:HEAT repeat protein